MKAWLNRLQGTHPFTHDLSLLLHTLEGLGANVESYWELLDLGGYAVRFRYEMLPEGEEPLNRDALLDDIGKLVAHVDELAG